MNAKPYIMSDKKTSNMTRNMTRVAIDCNKYSVEGDAAIFKHIFASLID